MLLKVSTSTKPPYTIFIKQIKKKKKKKIRVSNEITSINITLLVIYENANYYDKQKSKKTDIITLQLPDIFYQLCAVMMLLMFDISGIIYF